jgi:fimbrial chaperone protein
MPLLRRVCVAAAPVATAALTFISTAQAMSVSPMVIDMTTVGKNNHSQLSVLNDSAKPLPVEIIISRIDMTEDGKLVPKPAGDEFLIFPPQAMVAPGATQVFRVQWVGNELKISKTYSFSVNQVPVKLPKSKSGVQVVFNFGCIVNVAPIKGKSAIKLLTSTTYQDEKGKKHPQITVKNPGTIYAKLTDSTIKLAGGSWSQTLTPAQLRETMGIGLIQPGKTRKFKIPVDLPSGVTNITANINYVPPKK